MAIKVKHDGNVTSRIYASAAGGKGKRQADDAVRLAQLQASAQGRGGTGGGGGASAHAPTTHAPTGHAQLGSPGSFVSPQMSPETRMRLADDALNNDLVRQDFADAYRAAEQERQGDISLTNRLVEMDRASEIADRRELTSQGRRELSALREEFIRNYRNFGEAERPELLKSLGFAEDHIRLMDSLREHEPNTTERIKMQTGENGIVYSRDGSRVLYNPIEAQTAAEQKEREFKIREAELEAKRRESLEKMRADFIAKLMKPVKTGRKDDGSDDIRALSYEEAEKEARKAFPELYPAATSNPPQGGAANDAPDQGRGKKWERYADK